MKILVACEFSGIVRDAFRAHGHDAWSCDIIPTETPGPHIINDVRNVLDAGWDMMIAFPPCTYLANSGVRWLHERPDRWERMRQGAQFFRQLLMADIPLIALENPVMHHYAKDIIGKAPAQIVQPWQFGHGEVKKTCLWLHGLPPLMYPLTVDGREDRIHRMAPGPERGKERSRTFLGIADAMALQWGGLA